MLHLLILAVAQQPPKRSLLVYGMNQRVIVYSCA
jgi:hypothetical protein